ncbi:hypothetical protein FA13DRAFT_1133105 [Coprinellus micaceus]|uniref:Uncharacterized protein n=1 Tax=Coprinellus micaceus TaxID=71717 RepID=A0A4Y7SVI4_COPMI|nr:hypothetical protein FA13DRAFT_1133105 [Coprinellus micaceus]
MTPSSTQQQTTPTKQPWRTTPHRPLPDPIWHPTRLGLSLRRCEVHLRHIRPSRLYASECTIPLTIDRLMEQRGLEEWVPLPLPGLGLAGESGSWVGRIEGTVQGRIPEESDAAASTELWNSRAARDAVDSAAFSTGHFEPEHGIPRLPRRIPTPPLSLPHLR